MKNKICDMFKELQYNTNKINEIKQTSDNEIKKIKEWEEKEKATLEFENIRIQESLKAIYEQERIADPKYKITTQYGKIITRKVKDYDNGD